MNLSPSIFRSVSILNVYKMVSVFTHHYESYLTSQLLTHMLFINLFAIIHSHYDFRFSFMDFQIWLKRSRDGKKDGRDQIEERERVKNDGRRCKEDMRVTNNFYKVPHATQYFWLSHTCLLECTLYLQWKCLVAGCQLGTYAGTQILTSELPLICDSLLLKPHGVSGLLDPVLSVLLWRHTVFSVKV